jgi:predicted RNA binding protein YcfA (HicA-like mRNA interferase family)
MLNKRRVPLKTGEIIKLPGTDGWYLIATRGSHRQYEHPDKSNVAAGSTGGPGNTQL